MSIAMKNRKFSEFNVIQHCFELLPSEPRKRTMVDVGAQIGLWTIPYAKAGWKVIAYEASPPNYVTLKEKVEPLGLDITVVNKAVGDHNAPDIKFYYSNEYIGINSLKVNHRLLNENVFSIVNMVALATDLDRLGIEKVDFLKTDIEGADLLALRGFSFARHHPNIIVSEYGARSAAFKYSITDLVRFGLDYNYIPYVSSWESGGAWRVGDKPLEHKLEYFGRYKSTLKLNWGDVIFVDPCVENIFLDALSHFDI